MRFIGLTALALAGLAVAQTPAGFEPAVEEHLVVVFGDKAVEEPGTSLTKQETAELPTIGTMEPLEGTYTLIVFDISVPANFPPGNPEPRRTMLHAMISGWTSADEPNDDGVYVLTTEDVTKPASYLGPSPPAESPPKAHNYVELLFEEPEGWAAPKTDFSGFANRIGFDRDAFLESLGFPEPPVAANFFNVTGV